MSSLDQTVEGQTTVRLVRSFGAPVEEVFDAWTNPEVLRRWWAVEDSQRTAVAEVDLRIGGAYRLSMEDRESGARHTVGGEYREIRRPERLLYSWRWELDEGGLGHESVVSVEFLAEGEGTRVVLVHSGLEDPGSAERHSAGWTACLQRLGGVMEAARAA